MVVVRLRRCGRKKMPRFRIVVTDSRFSRDGRFIEVIGTYNPVLKDNKVQINSEKLKEWVKKGAKVSEKLKKLIKI